MPRIQGNLDLQVDRRVLGVRDMFEDTSSWTSGSSVRGWLQVLWDALMADEQACLGLIRSAGGHDAVVELIEGEATTEDALAYARTLNELGYLDEAREVFDLVVAAAFAFWDVRAVA